MKIKLAFTIFLFISCSSTNNRTYTFLEIIDLLKSDQIADQEKEQITNELNTKFEKEKGIEVVLENNYQTVEFMYHELSVDDVILKICVDALKLNPKLLANKIDIDCSTTERLFKEMYESDGQVRSEGGDILAVDNKNRQILISIIEKCGWIEDKTKHIWWLSHHNFREYIPYYYPELKKRVGTKNLSKANLAYMEDRMLMNAGYPQIYGTQSINGKLYDILNPESVNSRREDAGILVSENTIKTIEMECESLGISWEDELKRMKGSAKDNPIQVLQNF